MVRNMVDFFICRFTFGFKFHRCLFKIYVLLHLLCVSCKGLGDVLQYEGFKQLNNREC